MFVVDDGILVYAVEIMSAPSVYVTRIIHDGGLAMLTQAGFAVKVGSLRRPPDHNELIKQASRHDAIVCQVADRMDAAVLEAAKGRCKIIAACTVGYDNIDIATARRLGIPVTNTPDVLTEATADLTWALLLAAARRIGEAERLLRTGSWQGWNMLEFLGADVHGQTIGIVGAGRIGAAVARRAAGFGMTILYFDNADRPAMNALGARRVGLPELLEKSDFVSLHVPLTPETRQLIDARALGRMKRTAILVNTARGDVVDQAALIEALRTGQIAGAGLDVYQNEPRISRDFFELPNVVLLPHIGSATESTRRKMAETAAANVIAVLRGERPLTPVPA